MTVVKRFCDCCGKEIEDSADLAKLSIDCDYNVDKGYTKTIDLCVVCWGTVRSIFYNNFRDVLTQESTEEFDEEEK